MVTGLRRREWFALAAFAFSLVLAFTFVNATAHDDMAPRTPVLGSPLGPDGQPLATPTPTSVPVEVEAPEQGWLVRYVSLPSETLDGETTLETLDLHFDAAPFLYMEDDAWRLDAFARFDLPAGTQQFSIEVDGALRVFVNGSEVVSSPDSDGIRPITVLWSHTGERAAVHIEVTDSGGPVTLRWLE